MINTFIDAEWYIHQRIFLIGYAYENTKDGTIECRQLFKNLMKPADIIKILAPTTGKVFVYGPDIGMLEKVFSLDIRGYFYCLNLLKIVKDCYPGLTSYKLAAMEKKFGYKREAAKYKSDIFSIFRDWKDPKLRKLVMQYNLEDVYYLAKVKQHIWQDFHLPKQYLDSIRLKHK